MVAAAASIKLELSVISTVVVSVVSLLLLLLLVLGRFRGTDSPNEAVSAETGFLRGTDSPNLAVVTSPELSSNNETG